MNLSRVRPSSKLFGLLLRGDVGREAERAGAIERAADGVTYPDYSGPKTLDHVHVRESSEESPKNLVTLRNNSDLSSGGPLRVPRPYVEDCGKGTLATTYASGVISFAPLTCSSWSCSNCRKVNSARLLDRLRRGMESRPGLNRILVTLTIDPKIFGARIVGQRTREDGSPVNIVTPPKADQFEWVTEVMSTEWNKLNDRLGRKAKRGEVERHGYFRVVELHRNLWPHYHVLIEHPTWTAADLGQQLAGWTVGHTDARDILLDDAVGELAPYLTTAETKGGGHKAYQFAGLALPKGFRLHSSSEGFLADPREPDFVVTQGLVLKGHFASHHEGVKAWGGDSRLALEPPQFPDRPHEPPGSALASGDDALLYFLAQASLEPFSLSLEEEAFLL